LDYLEKGGRIGQAQALLGTMLRIKPLLIVEDGNIVPLEKVRTRSQVIDKLVDFVAEFARVERVAILCSGLATGMDELTDELRQRLGEVLPGSKFPLVRYDPVLACHVGPEALGVIVYEGI
jgi:DegV family protein with EDD domain